MNCAIQASTRSWTSEGKAEKIMQMQTVQNEYEKEPSKSNLIKFILVTLGTQWGQTR